MPANTVVTEGSAMSALLPALFNSLCEGDYRYCLLRDGHRLDEIDGEIDGEIDLLVAKEDFAALARTLMCAGFVCLPVRGYHPHHFFVTYDHTGDRWLKLDVVTEIAYGAPVAALRTALAEECLRSRRNVAPAFLPAPETPDFASAIR